MVIFFLLSGCQASYDSTAEAPPAPPSVSAGAEGEIKKQSDGFLKAVQASDFAKAFSFLSPELQKKTPLTELAAMGKSGALKPLVTATNLRLEPVLVTGKGKRATQRLAFDSGGQKDYHMNIIQEKVGVDWKITTIMPPVKFQPASVSGAQGAVGK